MKVVWLLVGCVGCGGGPNFVLAQDEAPIVIDAGPGAVGVREPTPDAGPDTPTPDAPRAEAATTSDAGAVTDAADAADAGVEAASDVGVDSPAAPDAPPLTIDLIDDIDSETQPGWILSRGGRLGSWFTYDDGTSGGVVPAPNSPLILSESVGRPGNLAEHMTGNGAAVYAGIGFLLHATNPYNNGAIPYDASAYQGFTFWGRTGSGTTPVKFAVPDIKAAAGPEPAGGYCAGGGRCGDYFAKTLTFTSDWQQFAVYYSDLAQDHPTSAMFDAARVYGCLFQTASGPTFDVWIDDVYFIK